MHTDVMYKIPGGKLVRLSLDFDTTHITRARIYGDFFIHPEETIHDMELCLTNLAVETTAERIEALLQNVVEQHQAELIGIDTLNLSKRIREAIRQ